MSVCAATVIIATSGSRHEESSGPAPVPAVLRLNDTLTNILSDIPDLDGMDSMVSQYLKKWEIKGASLAIMRNDSLVYAKGYGFADEEAGEEMSPRNILRMASV